MKKGSIFFLVETPFLKFHYDRFGIDYLKSRGYEVCVFDFTMCLNKYSDQNSREKVHDFSGLIEVMEFNDFQRAYKNRVCSKRWVIDNLGKSFCAQKVRKIICKDQETVVGFIKTSTLIHIRNNPFQRFWEKFRYHDRKILKIIERIALKFQRKIDYKFVLNLGGDVLAGPTFKKRLQIWAHTFDYERYTNITESGRKSEGKKYLLFLDELIGEMIDTSLLAINPLPRERYLETVNAFLKSCEIEYKCPAYIAAHPKNMKNRSTLSKEFGNRIIISGDTLGLIKCAQLVIGHASASIGFAVLANRNILLITTNEIMKSHKHKYIVGLSSALGIKPINIDTTYEFVNIEDYRINPLIRDRYIRQYVKSDFSQEKEIWETFLDEMEVTFG